MRRWSGGCALVALVLSWNLAVAEAAERISLLSADDASDVEGVVNLTGDDFLSFVSQGETAGAAWIDDGYVYDNRWTIWAGAIFLSRDNPSSQTLASSGGIPLFNARGIDYGTAVGPDINAIRHGEIFDVGFRYFHVNGMSDHRRIFPPGVVNLNMGSTYSFLCPRLDEVALTNIQSVEINLRKNLTSNLTVLAGFRYLALDDDLGYKFDILGDAFDLFTLKSFAINRLYGAQAGVDANVVTFGRFQLQTALKAGVYGNAARNQMRLRTLNVLDTSIGTNATQTSFVGDWNFSGIVQLTDVWAIRGGYQLLWLSNVALAPDQFRLGDLLTPGIAIDTTGDLFLHGALVSLQAGW